MELILIQPALDLVELALREAKIIVVLRKI